MQRASWQSDTTCSSNSVYENCQLVLYVTKKVTLHVTKLTVHKVTLHVTKHHGNNQSTMSSQPQQQILQCQIQLHAEFTCYKEQEHKGPTRLNNCQKRAICYLKAKVLSTLRGYRGEARLLTGGANASPKFVKTVVLSRFSPYMHP